MCSLLIYITVPGSVMYVTVQYCPWLIHVCYYTVMSLAVLMCFYILLSLAVFLCYYTLLSLAVLCVLLYVTLPGCVICVTLYYCV